MKYIIAFVLLLASIIANSSILEEMVGTNNPIFINMEAKQETAAWTLCAASESYLVTLIENALESIEAIGEQSKAKQAMVDSMRNEKYHSSAVAISMLIKAKQPLTTENIDASLKLTKKMVNSGLSVLLDYSANELDQLSNTCNENIISAKVYDRLVYF